MSGKNIAGTLIVFLTLILSFVAITCFFLKAWVVFWVCLVISIASFTVFLIVRFDEITTFFHSRQLRYGTNVILSILGVIGIAVFVNIIFSQRFNKRVDLTELKRYSLSEQTRHILKKLDKKIHIIAFFKESNRYTQEVKNILDLYAYETKNLTVKLLDPDIERNIAETYGIERDGYTVFDDGKRFETATVVDEQAFTSALLKIIQNKTKKVYFLSGHGERSIDDFSNRGYQQVKTELEKINYEVFSLSLLREQQIPTDCDALVIAGPTKPLKRQELDTIERYLAKNGKLLLLLDPSHNSVEDVNGGLVQLMNKWGVKVGNDLVIDRVHSFLLLGGPTTLDLKFEPHDITRDYLRLQIPYIYCRSVTPIEDVPNLLSVKSIVKTIGAKGVSWGETERNEDGTFSNNGYTPNVDLPAPVSIAAVVEKLNSENSTKKEASTPTRIVVFGDSDFASDTIFATPDPNIPAYAPIINSMINWLTLEDDIINIARIDYGKQVLRRMNDYQMRFVQIISVFLIPLLVFISGIVVWWVRRVGGNL